MVASRTRVRIQLTIFIEHSFTVNFVENTSIQNTKLGLADFKHYNVFDNEGIWPLVKKTSYAII